MNKRRAIAPKLVVVLQLPLDLRNDGPTINLAAAKTMVTH
jgi:hypothetical protein